MNRFTRTKTMRMQLSLCIAAILCAAGMPASPCHAQEPPAEAIYIIFDGSGSMWQKLADGTYKIAAAKQVLTEFVQDEFSGYDLAFRAYGHRRKGDCRDSELVVPFGAASDVVPRLKSFMADVNPTGKTPIRHSLLEALRDLDGRAGEIILISDGEETCDADPCELVREWREKQVNIRVHVVGLGLNEMSKEALQCISEAAGTPYHDAQSANELAGGLRKIREVATAPSLVVKGRDAAGELLLIEGSLLRSGKKRYDISSAGRHQVDPGDYTLLAGVRTRNGSLYLPVTRAISVKPTGETRVELEVVRPPSVRSKFFERGTETPGRTLVYAFRDGKEQFRFRWMDEVFLEEGNYEFRAKPNAFNDLSVTETFAAGDRKQIIFEMQPTVQVLIKMVAAGSGILFRQNYALWQNGEKKHNVHIANGARVLPGTYDLHLPDVLTPYVAQDLVITEEPEQQFEIEVPVGHVTVIYRNADGTRAKDARCFMSSLNPGSSGKSKFRNAGQRYPLVPGRYKVEAWSRMGDIDPVEFEIQMASDIEVVLQIK